MTQREKLNVRLDAENLAFVDEMATRERRTRSDMIRILLEEAIEARITSDLSTDFSIREEVAAVVEKTLRSFLAENFPGAPVSPQTDQEAEIALRGYERPYIPRLQYHESGLAQLREFTQLYPHAMNSFE